jgi:hypothetical protein
MSLATRDRLIALIGDEGDDEVEANAVEADSSDDEEGSDSGPGSRPTSVGGGGKKSALLKPESLQLPSVVHSPEDVKPYVGWMHKMGGGKKKVRHVRLQQPTTTATTRTCTHTHAHAHAHAHARTHARTHTRARARAHTHTRTHAHTHTISHLTQPQPPHA